MEQTTLTVEIITPEEVLESSEAAMVVVPGVEGDFGVLPGHAPVIAMIRPGTVSVYDRESDVRQTVFVTGGISEVKETRCVILAEQAVSVDKLDKSEAQERLQRAKDALAAPDVDANANTHAVTSLKKELTIAQAMVDTFTQ